MNCSTRSRYAVGSTLERLPAGFCPPLKCQKAIMANRIRHQTKAMVNQTFSALWAGFHQIPVAGVTPVVCMIGPSSGEPGLGEVRHLPQSPEGEQGQHDDHAERQEHERFV